MTMKVCETLSGPTCSAACSQSSPTMPPTISAYTGHRVNMPPKPRALMVSVVALMNVASNAHMTAVALAKSAARRAGDTRCAKTIRSAMTATHTTEGTVHADERGRNDPPCGDATTRNVTSPAPVTTAANHVTPRID